MRKIAVLAAAGALLSGAAPPRAQDRSAWRLTPDGLGPVRIGMSRADVTRIVRVPLEGQELTEGCI